MMANRISRRAETFWIILCTAACLSAIWLPYGFSMGGLIEEWDLLAYGQKYSGLWSSFPGQPFDQLFGVRPLLPSAFALAAKLSSRSFLGFHVLLIVASTMKILAGISIGKLLFRDTSFALCFGLLFLVYPPDTQQICLRTFAASLAIGVALIVTLLFLRDYLVARARACPPP